MIKETVIFSFVEIKQNLYSILWHDIPKSYLVIRKNWFVLLFYVIVSEEHIKKYQIFLYYL